MTRECIAFLGMCSVGATAGVLYDIFRALRKTLKSKRTAVGDVCYWLCATVGVWYAFLFFSDGRLRGFEIFGLILGAFLYHMLLSGVILKVFSNLFKFFFKILLTPTEFLYKIICRVLLGIKATATSFVERSMK